MSASGWSASRRGWRTCVAAGGPDVAAEARFERVRTGQEFELFCAEELERGGWRVSLTGASRDQGADLVAERAAERLVVQCKLLGRPVGNYAVQEVVAARSHQHANRALVASNQRFTASCVELAASQWRRAVPLERAGAALGRAPARCSSARRRNCSTSSSSARRVGSIPAAASSGQRVWPARRAGWSAASCGAGRRRRGVTSCQRRAQLGRGLIGARASGGPRWS